MDERRPMAFLSYAHFADSFDNGYLSKFSLRLSGEVCLQLGDEFPIFQDRKDISWGNCWRERINSSLDKTTFLIPVITPGFFKSEYCREELSRFLDREKKLGRNDLILPVLYIDTPALYNKKLQANDELTQIIASRQFVDWRNLRFEDLNSRDARMAISNLAAQICKALYWLDSIQERETDTNPSIKSPIEPPSIGQDATEVKAIVVDQIYRGDYTTINAAISAAAPGSRILIKEGVYDEEIIVNKPLEIVGDGEIGDVVIRASERDAILFNTVSGKISNLLIEQNRGGDWFGVAISQGFLELDGCDITSDGRACVGVFGNAYPRIISNKIHDGIERGIDVYENGQGVIEDNEIYGNVLSGVEISEGGNPTLRRNKIHDGKTNGIFVHENGQGSIEDNDIYGNAFSGIEISEGGNPTIRHNRINNNSYRAIYIRESGAGIIEDNDLRENKRGPWYISEDSKPLVKCARNQEK